MKISDIHFKQIVLESYYLKDVLFKCGYKNSLNKRSRDKVKNRINILKLTTKHFKYNKSKNIQELCIKNGKYHRGGLKRRLIKNNILKEECNSCKLKTIWNNKKLVLQLDHINGNNCDNRIENLRLLCPNCHSQTNTFAGKNKRIKIELY